MTTATPDVKTKIIIAALTVGAFAIGLDTFVIIGALDILATDLRISSSMAGWIISIYALAYAIFAPLNAWLFRDMSRRNVQVFSMSLFLIGNLICALAPRFLDPGGRAAGLGFRRRDVHACRDRSGDGASTS